MADDQAAPASVPNEQTPLLDPERDVLNEQTPLPLDLERDAQTELESLEPQPTPGNWRQRLVTLVVYAFVGLFVFSSLVYFFFTDELVDNRPPSPGIIGPYPHQYTVRWESSIVYSPVRNYQTIIPDPTQESGDSLLTTLTVIRRGRWLISGQNFYLQMQEARASPADPTDTEVYTVGDIVTGFSWWQLFFSDVPSSLYITFNHFNSTDRLLRCEYITDFYSVYRRCPGDESHTVIAIIYDGIWDATESYIYNPKDKSDMYAVISKPRGMWLREWDIRIVNRPGGVPFPNILPAIHVAHRDIWENYLDSRDEEKRKKKPDNGGSKQI